MKPMGMTAAFQIVTSNRIQDKMYEAAEGAVEAGWTAQQAIEELRECWRIALDQRRKDDDATFREVNR